MFKYAFITVMFIGNALVLSAASIRVLLLDQKQKPLEKALAWSPWNSGMANNLARTYIRLGNSARARELAKQTSEYELQEPSKIEMEVMTGVNFEEGRMSLERREFPKVIASMTEALKGDPQLADAYHALALAYGHQGSYAEALKNIDQALALRPDDANFQQVKKLLEHNASVSASKK